MQTIRYKRLLGVYYPTTKKNSRGLIIVALGAPNIEDIESLRNADILTDSGYDLFVPEYYGFCRSGGSFSPENSLRSLIDAYKIFSDGLTCYDIYSMLPFQKKHNNIIFLGLSYGGGLVMKLPKYCPNVQIISAFYPVMNYRGLGVQYQEETGEDFLDMIKKEFKNLYRISDLSEWRRYFSENHGFNSEEDIKSMSELNIFLAHGTMDTSINYRRTKKYYAKLKRIGNRVSTCNIYPGLGHGYETMIPATYDFIKWLDTVSINPNLPLGDQHNQSSSTLDYQDQ